jgi:hypothetical protein
MSSQRSRKESVELSAPASRISGKSRRGMEQTTPSLELLEERLLLSVPATWTPTGVGSTGTTYWPQISPSGSQQQIYMNGDMGEDYYTSNFGNSWQTVNGNLGLGDAVIKFTANPNQLFAYSSNNGPDFNQSADGG